MLEGIAFNLSWILENIKRDFGFSPSKIRAIGGGSVNDQWIQGIANITGKTVETLTQPTMAGALGAATCVFVGTKHFKSFHEINKILRVKKAFVPDSTSTEIFKKLFNNYKNIYTALEKTYLIANAERFISKN